MLNYIAITICKNEGKNLPSLFDSLMVKQTIKPSLWLIVDDGSEDNTSEIINKIKDEYPIQYIQLGKGERDIGIHVSKLISFGFESAIEYCRKKNVIFDYMANIDGDIILAPDFFEHIISCFEKRTNLGIASGGLYHKIKGEIIRENIKQSEPSGSTLVISHKCFKDCEKIIISRVWESALISKARMKGWDTKRVEEAVSIETRLTNSAEGFWKGYSQKGRGACYLDYPMSYALLKGLFFTLKKPYYTGIAYIYGYCSLYLKREKIDDTEIRYYYHNIRPKEIRDHYKNRVKQYLKIEDNYELSN